MQPEVVPSSPDYIRIVLTRWRKVLVSACAFTLVTAIAVLILPRTYEATVTLLVYPPVFKESEQAAPSRAFTAEGVSTELAEMMPRTFPVETYRTIAESKDLIKEVIDKLQLKDMTVEALSSDLLVELPQLATRNPSGTAMYAQTILLHARASQPTRAAQLAQTWADLFKGRADLLALRGATETYELIDQMWGISKGNLERTQDKLETFRKDYNLELMKSEKKEKEDLLTKLATKLDKTEIDVADNSAKLAAVQEELAKEKRVDALFSSPSADIYWQIEKKLYPGAEQNPLTPKEGLLAETHNPNYTTTRDREVKVKGTLKGLENKRTHLKEIIDRLRTEIDVLQKQIAECDTKQSRLTMDMSTFDENYKVVAQKLQKGWMAMTNRTSDIQIAAKAVVPERAVGMRLMFKIALAALIGALIGIAYVIVEYSVRSGAPVSSS